jgi:Fungal specific transcription factor domain
MAVCAVSSQTVALNAIFDHTLLEGLPSHDSDKYCSEAVSKIPVHIAQSQDLDYLRTFGLLALYSLRRGDHCDLHRYLGLYHALVAQNGFHDESCWPRDISISEVDDRRRQFWCVYRLEIHSACVLGHMVRMPESQVSVLYPRITPAMDPETQAWTAGWDYITDHFRLLEYAIFSLRTCKDRKAVFAVLCNRPSPTTLLDSFARLKASKPRILLGLREPDSSFQSNRCKYMIVQINCTETLVNIMVLLYCQAPAREVMDIAESFLEEVTKAPLIMFKVASSQIVHQLVGVGHMLYTASQYDDGLYRPETRRLITFLGDLVQSLDDDIPSAAEAGERLLSLAEAIS